MKCEKCGADIMKADNYCSRCAAPNPRNEHAEKKLREAVLEVAVAMGVDVEDADGSNGKYAWETFTQKMWAPSES